MTNLQFFAVGIIWILWVCAVALWKDKMIKVILWNYVVWMVCMTLSYIIDLLSQSILRLQIKFPANKSYSSLYQFFTNGKMRIILFVYLCLVILIFTKSKLDASVDHVPVPKFILNTILVVLTVSWIILTLSLSIWWADIIGWTLTSSIATTYFWDSSITQFLKYTPVWILIHWIITLYLISDWLE
jgi:hypothetical protein